MIHRRSLSFLSYSSELDNVAMKDDSWRRRGRRAYFFVLLLCSIINMKRTKHEKDDSSSSESSSSLSDHEGDSDSGKSKASDRRAGRLSKERKIEAKSGKQKSGVDFEALRRYGYRGGPSVLGMPQPKEIEKRDWTWSTGKESRKNNDTEESYEERRKTRAALTNGEQLATLQARDEKKNLSFSQKEKRKRELGQASRGKNYVEEEKRLLRESGVYSGLDA